MSKATELYDVLPDTPANPPTSFDFGDPESPPGTQWITNELNVKPHQSAVFLFELTPGTATFVEFEIEVAGPGDNDEWHRVPGTDTSATPSALKQDGSLLRATLGDFTALTSGDYRIVLPSQSVKEVSKVRCRARADTGDVTINRAEVMGGVGL